MNEKRQVRAFPTAGSGIPKEKTPALKTLYRFLCGTLRTGLW